jgi:predicted TIM-barrel fold metal-dependent hydrolase
MQLEHYRPHSKLVTHASLIEKPRFPVIDAHNHLNADFGGDWIEHPLPELIEQLDQAGVQGYVDLDGGWGEDILQSHLEKLGGDQRFRMFGGVHWDAWPEMGNAFPEWAAQRLRVQAGWGARGLKIWKGFGLHVRDQHGALVQVDDPRLDPLWQTAGELGLPVTIHVADPVAFFDPLDETNERWEEIGSHPDWAFPSPPFPPFLTVVNGLANLVARHPQTIFIGAHVGCYSEDLGWVGAVLERCPNFFVDISARISELGRQPYTARKFFLQYASRILFGLDFGPSVDYYRIFYRFLETSDEYFNYNPGEIPHQGRWAIYGLDLPDDVLKKVYFENASKLLGFA